MSRMLNTSNDNDKEMLATILQKAAQSANLNFIIGSGCSLPAIEVLGETENEIQERINVGKNDEAELLLFEYLEPFVRSVESMKGILVDEFADVLENYKEFLKVISKILFERKHNILSKQANIFTTNYDLFVEKASESFLGSIKLNDGFSRFPSLENKFSFSTSEFFNSVYNNGNLYNYQVQIPSINLIKLHGSLSWKDEDDRIIFSCDHYTSVMQEMEKIQSDEDISKIKEFNNRLPIILPNNTKYKYTLLEQIYYDLLRIYANELDKENTLLVAEGFSFDDKHILQITIRALRNPTLRLMIFAHSQNSAKKYEKKFHRNSNVNIIYSDKEKIDFAAFIKMLKDIPAVANVTSSTIPEEESNE